MSKQGNRSKRYQHKFREIGVDSVDVFPNEKALHLQEDIDHKRQVYKEKILREIFEIAEEQLTQRQKDILYCRYVLGMTQVAIGVRLGITQGCVSLQLNGIPNYIYGKKHGGIIPKLRKMCIGEAQIIANRINDDEEMKKMISIIKSRIRKAHSEYNDAEVMKCAIQGLSRMGKVADLFERLIRADIDELWIEFE